MYCVSYTLSFAVSLTRIKLMSKGSAPYLFEPEYSSDECPDLSDSSSAAQPKANEK